MCGTSRFTSTRLRPPPPKGAEHEGQPGDGDERGGRAGDPAAVDAALEPVGHPVVACRREANAIAAHAAGAVVATRAAEARLAQPAGRPTAAVDARLGAIGDAIIARRREAHVRVTAHAAVAVRPTCAAKAHLAQLAARLAAA